jgi:hypothetical protein
MGKFLKYTGSFTLGLACFILVAHLLIPHHHDFDISSSCESSTHCHALNNLIEDKHILVLEIHKDILNLEFPSFEFTSDGSFDQTLACLAFKNIGFIEVKQTPINSGYLKVSSLRAPPSLV